MIKVNHLIKNKVVSGDVASLNKKSDETWIDCNNPTKKQLRILAEQLPITEDDFFRGLDEDERPGLLDFDEFSVVTFRAPMIDKKGSLTTIPISFFLYDHYIIILRKYDIESLDRIYSLGNEKKASIMKKDMTVSFSLYNFLSEIINDFFKHIDMIEDQIEKVEEKVFTNPHKKVVKEIFSMKKTLIFFHKALTGNREVITGIEKEFVKQIKGRSIKKFRYLYNDITQLIDMVGTYRDILIGSLDIYLTSISNNLNEVMKKLTVITSLALLPTLIASIYGMNFRYMPELRWRFGYYFSLGLMVFSIAAMYYYFKKRDWI